MIDLTPSSPGPSEPVLARVPRPIAFLFLFGIGGRAAWGGQPIRWGDRFRLGLGGWLLLGVTGLLVVLVAVWFLWLCVRIAALALAAVMMLGWAVAVGACRLLNHS